MNNIKSLIAALTFAGLTACADNSPKTFSGFITDASMNTVTVRALTDESTFAIMAVSERLPFCSLQYIFSPPTVRQNAYLKSSASQRFAIAFVSGSLSGTGPA